LVLIRFRWFLLFVFALLLGYVSGARADDVKNKDDIKRHKWFITVYGGAHAQDTIEDQIRKAGQQLRYKYVSRLGDFRQYATDVWEGIPFVEIVKYGRENHADLIVMAHNTRMDAEDETSIGSVAQQVVLRANCPVITINRSFGKQ